MHAKQSIPILFCSVDRFNISAVPLVLKNECIIIIILSHDHTNFFCFAEVDDAYDFVYCGG